MLATLVGDTVAWRSGVRPRGVTMWMARRIELVSGVAAAVLGGASLAYAVFGPTYTDGLGNWRSVAEMSLNPVSITFLILMFAAIVGVGVGAALHSRGRGAAWLTVTVVCVVILLVGAAVSMFSVGAFLLPALLPAALALAAGGRAQAVGS